MTPEELELSIAHLISIMTQRKTIRKLIITLCIVEFIVSNFLYSYHYYSQAVYWLVFSGILLGIWVYLNHNAFNEMSYVDHLGGPDSDEDWDNEIDLGINQLGEVGYVISQFKKKEMGDIMKLQNELTKKYEEHKSAYENQDPEVTHLKWYHKEQMAFYQGQLNVLLWLIGDIEKP